MPPKPNPPLQPASLSTSANLGTLPGRIKRARGRSKTGARVHVGQPGEFYRLNCLHFGVLRRAIDQPQLDAGAVSMTANDWFQAELTLTVVYRNDVSWSV